MWGQAFDLAVAEIIDVPLGVASTAAPVDDTMAETGE